MGDRPRLHTHTHKQKIWSCTYSVPALSTIKVAYYRICIDAAQRFLFGNHMFRLAMRYCWIKLHIDWLMALYGLNAMAIVHLYTREGNATKGMDVLWMLLQCNDSTSRLQQIMGSFLRKPPFRIQEIKWEINSTMIVAKVCATLQVIDTVEGGRDTWWEIKYSVCENNEMEWKSKLQFRCFILQK